MKTYKIRKIEPYTKGEMKHVCAHNYMHVDRVRNWALKISGKEGFCNLEIIEVAALLHNIGKAYSIKESLHGAVGAKMACSVGQLFSNQHINLFPYVFFIG